MKKIFLGALLCLNACQYTVSDICAVDLPDYSFDVRENTKLAIDEDFSDREVGFIMEAFRKWNLTPRLDHRTSKHEVITNDFVYIAKCEEFSYKEWYPYNAIGMTVSSNAFAILSDLDDEQMSIVPAHEIGHLLGLDHDSEPGDLMSVPPASFQPSEKDLIKAKVR